jgi:hypothetical protein
MKTESKTQERVFSVELKSKEHIKNINLANNGQNSFFIEGTLGSLEHAWFEEGIILEIVGKKGVLRINLEQNEIQKKQLNSGEEKTQ